MENGAAVETGDVIGYVGHTGYTDPEDFSHIHYEQENPAGGTARPVTFDGVGIDVHFGGVDPNSAAVTSTNCGDDALAPSGRIALGPDGRIVLVGVKKSGVLYTRTGVVGSGWNGFYKQSTSTTWADASIAIGTDGKYRLLAIKENGTLHYRIGTPGKGWGRFTTLGRANSWAPGTADIVTGPGGTIAIRAVKKSGTMYARTASTSTGWDGFVRQGVADSWSTGP